MLRDAKTAARANLSLDLLLPDEDSLLPHPKKRDAGRPEKIT